MAGLVHDPIEDVPEFETELVKKVLGQLADLSRHGEICFNIDDKMLP